VTLAVLRAFTFLRQNWQPGLTAFAILLSAEVARAQDTTAAGERPAIPQRDLLDILSRILHGRPDSVVVVEPAPKVVFTVLPAFSVNPATGFLFGLSATALTRFGPEETTNSSNAAASVNYTTKSQFNVLVRSNIFGSNNGFLLQGDWRYQDTSQPTYGLGPAQPESRKDDLEYQLIRIYQTAYRPLSGGLMAGIGYHLDDYYNIVDPAAEQGLSSPLLDYNAGRTVTKMLSSGFSLDLALDNRDSPVYATRGYYGTASLRIFPTWLGSDTAWQSFQTDFRLYTRLGATSRSVFAVWGTTWFTFGPVPYLSLPAIGWDTYARSGRGYPQGRIRGHNQLYLEGEYRVELSRDGLLGAAAFLNMLSTSDPATGTFERANLAGGVGLRIKLNKRSSTNITLDFGWGAQGSNGLFMGTGEAF
jgi:hypothetical protein